MRFQKRVSTLEGGVSQAIEDLYLEAVSYGIPHTFGDIEKDPFLASSKDELNKRMRSLKKIIKNHKFRKRTLNHF